MRMGGPSGSPIWLFRALARPGLPPPPAATAAQHDLCPPPPRQSAAAARHRGSPPPPARPPRPSAAALELPAAQPPEPIHSHSQFDSKFRAENWHQICPKTLAPKNESNLESLTIWVGMGPWLGRRQQFVGSGWAVKADGTGLGREGGWPASQCCGPWRKRGPSLAGGETGPLRPPKRHAPRSHPHKSR